MWNLIEIIFTPFPNMLVFLLQPEHAPFLFETVGRPDVGLTLRAGHLFCDWLIRPESLIRTYAIDVQELSSTWMTWTRRTGSSDGCTRI